MGRASRLTRPCVLLVLGLAASADLATHPSHASLPPATPGAVAGTFEHDGFRVEMQIRPVRRRGSVHSDKLELFSGSEASIRFAIHGSGTNRPLSGVFPMAWLVADDPSRNLDDPAQCRRFLRGLLLGRLARKAEVNLNEYHLVTLDENNSLSIIDPQIESAKTKTLGMISLPARGVSFAISRDHRTVFASLDQGGRVALADLTRMNARYVDVGGEPGNVAVLPDADQLWVGDRSGSHVTVIDTDKVVVQGSVEVGSGPHEIGFRADGQYAFVSSPAERTVAVVDPRTLEIVAKLEIDGTPVTLAVATSAGKVYAARRDGTLLSFDDRSLRRIGALRLPGELNGVGVSRDGRWLVAFETERDRLFIVDTATDRLVHRIGTLRAPVRVDFSEAFAYVRHAESERYQLLELGSLGHGDSPKVADVPLGERPPGRDAPAERTFVPLPEGGGALILNAADRSVFHFAEGMSAPMGSYSLYPWPARGVLLADRSLRETSEGAYETFFRTPRAGLYRAVFLISSSPKLYDCSLGVQVASPSSGVPERPLEIEAPFLASQLVAGERSNLEIILREPKGHLPKNGVQDLALRARSAAATMRSNWSSRTLANTASCSEVVPWASSTPTCPPFASTLPSQGRRKDSSPRHEPRETTHVPAGIPGALWLSRTAGDSGPASNGCTRLTSWNRCTSADGGAPEARQSRASRTRNHRSPYDPGHDPDGPGRSRGPLLQRLGQGQARDDERHLHAVPRHVPGSSGDLRASARTARRSPKARRALDLGQPGPRL
jgi:DNA-binding beta-propeller fold protein YncE